MDERLRFIARLLDGEGHDDGLRGIRHRPQDRVQALQALQANGRAGPLGPDAAWPLRHANQLPLAIEQLIVRLKKQYPNWGAPNFREKLRPPCAPVQCPAISTVHAVLYRHGLVRRRGRRRPRVTGTPLRRSTTPNALWCADFKGEFMLADRRYGYPLTITDFASRYLLSCEALESTRADGAFPVFERVFQEFGLPLAIRTDNGAPFASAWALHHLSKLAVWWLRLGIGLERITPGPPRAKWAARADASHLEARGDASGGANVLQQQARFDDFVERYNRERPHQALDMRVPADLYMPSPRVYRGLEDLEYPFHDWTVVVTRLRPPCFKARKINFSHVFAGQKVGIRQVDDAHPARFLHALRRGLFR